MISDKLKEFTKELHDLLEKYDAEIDHLEEDNEYVLLVLDNKLNDWTYVKKPTLTAESLKEFMNANF